MKTIPYLEAKGGIRCRQRLIMKVEPPLLQRKLGRCISRDAACGLRSANLNKVVIDQNKNT